MQINFSLEVFQAPGNEGLRKRRASANVVSTFGLTTLTHKYLSWTHWEGKRLAQWHIDLFARPQATDLQNASVSFIISISGLWYSRRETGSGHAHTKTILLSLAGIIFL